MKNVMWMGRCCALAGTVLLLAGTAFADDKHDYGVVESFDGKELVIHLREGATGHYKTDASTKVDGKIARGSWIYVDVQVSGVIKSLKFVLAPTPRAGTVKTVKGNVMHVASGNKIEEWNIVPSTIRVGLTGVPKVGDVLKAEVYDNQNLAIVEAAK